MQPCSPSPPRRTIVLLHRAVLLVIVVLQVYAYFSKAAVASESLVAILLCMGVAAFDIVLLLLRWLWLEQYIAYG